jgi:hypothetical protein
LFSELKFYPSWSMRGQALGSDQRPKRFHKLRVDIQLKHMVGCPWLKAERPLSHEWIFVCPGLKAETCVTCMALCSSFQQVLNKAIRHPLSVSQLYKPTHMSLLDLHSPKLAAGCCYTTKREGRWPEVLSHLLRRSCSSLWGWCSSTWPQVVIAHA